MCGAVNSTAPSDMETSTQHWQQMIKDSQAVSHSSLKMMLLVPTDSFTDTAPSSYSLPCMKQIHNLQHDSVVLGCDTSPSYMRQFRVQTTVSYMCKLVRKDAQQVMRKRKCAMVPCNCLCAWSHAFIHPRDQDRQSSCVSILLVFGRIC
jgi:hypothetical protein